MITKYSRRRNKEIRIFAYIWSPLILLRQIIANLHNNFDVIVSDMFDHLIYCWQFHVVQHAFTMLGLNTTLNVSTNWL